MVLTSGTAWPRRLLIAVVLAAVLAVRVPIGLGDDTSVPSTLPAAAAAPSVADSAKDCAKNPIALATSFLGCTLAKSAKGAIKDAAGDGFKSIAKSMAQGWVKIIELALAWFIKIPTPEYAEDSVITDIQQRTVQLQIYGLVLSILIGSYKLVRARRQAVMNEAEESFTSLAKTVFGAWMFGGVLTVCTAASDSLADWMLDQGAENNEQLIANLGAANLVVGMGSGLVFVVAVVGILGGFLQAVLLIGRQAMLAVVVAVIPVVGSFGGDLGRQRRFLQVDQMDCRAAVVEAGGRDRVLGGLQACRSRHQIPERRPDGADGTHPACPDCAGAADPDAAGIRRCRHVGRVGFAGRHDDRRRGCCRRNDGRHRRSPRRPPGAHQLQRPPAHRPALRQGPVQAAVSAAAPEAHRRPAVAAVVAVAPAAGRCPLVAVGPAVEPVAVHQHRPPPGGSRNSPEQSGGNGATGGSGTGGPSMGDAATASNAVMSASQTLFDDSFESSVSDQEGSYR
ncbi:hypothetical protein MTX80_22925 (plasmid) [Gordonia amicalis]|nr:hypothetical protein [Gordonia amicalis]UOG23679.1 hypothetical protein MTX80_22925 [Gordonia amicalis]